MKIKIIKNKTVSHLKSHTFIDFLIFCETDNKLLKMALEERFGRPGEDFFGITGINQEYFETPNNRKELAQVIVDTMVGDNDEYIAPQVSSTYAVALHYLYANGHLDEVTSAWLEDEHRLDHMAGRSGSWNAVHSLRAVLFDDE